MKTRETLDKYAASKYKDRLFEDGFAGIRSEPGRIKETRARQDGKEAATRQKRLAIFENKKLLFASHYTVLKGVSFYSLVFSSFPYLTVKSAMNGIHVKQHIHTPAETSKSWCVTKYNIFETQK